MADFNLVAETNITAQGAEVTNGQSIQVRRNLFVKEESTGNTINKNLKDKGEGINTEFAVISDRVIQSYRKYLGDYMTNLVDLKKDRPDIFDQPGHEHEKMLLGIMGDSNPEKRAMDIAVLLGTTNGLKIATQIVETQAAYKLNAIGLYITSTKPGERDKVAQPLTVRTGEGQGAMNKVINDKIKPFLGENGKKKIAGVSVAMGGAGAVIGGLFHVTNATGGTELGVALGAASMAGALALTKETMKSFKDGEKVDLVRTVDGLNNLKNNLDEAEYMQVMYKINVHDFDTTGGNVTVDAGVAAGMVSQLQNEAVQALEMRNEFYKCLGVSANRLDRMPEEFLFKYDDKQVGPEQTNSKLQIQLYKAFNPDRDILDTAGRSRIDWTAIPPVPNPAFDRAHLDNAGNQERLRLARSKVLVDLTADYIKNEQVAIAAGNKREKPLAALKAKKAEYDGEVALGKRSKLETEKIAKLGKNKEDLEKNLKEFDDVNKNQKKLSEIVEKLSEPPYSITFTTTEPSSVDVNREVSKAVGALEATLRAPGPPPGPQVELATIKSQFNRYVIDEVKNRNKDQAAALGTKSSLSREIQNEILQQVKEEANDLYQDAITRLTKEVKTITDKIDELSNWDGEFRVNTTSLRENELKVLDKAPKELVAIRRAYDTLISPGTGTPTINDIMLQTQSVDELLALAVAAPYGLPNKSAKEQQDLRKLILDAKTESKARQKERLNPSPAAQRRAMNEVALNPGLPITADDLFKRTDAELVHILTTDPAYAGLRARTADYRLEIGLAKLEARKQLRNRYNLSITEGIADADLQVEALKKTIELKGDIETERAIIDSAADIAARQSDIFTKSESVVSKDLDKFMDLSKYTKADYGILAESEQFKTRPPKGYYEFMDLLFDYRERADKDEYFKKISTALPPKKLATILNKSLDLGQRDNLNDVLTEMNTRIANSAISGQDMRLAFVQIMDRLQDEALSLS